jgi:hypothetical protein
MVNNELLSEIEALQEYALAAVEETIAIASMRTRTLEDSVTRDVALMDELAYSAFKSIDHHLDFTNARVIVYLQEFPELLDAPSSGETTRDALRLATMRLIVNQMLPDIKVVHQDQFSLWTGADAGVWCAAALEKLGSVGAVVNTATKFAVSMFPQMETPEAFQKETETVDWISDHMTNLERYRLSQRVDEKTKNEISVLARRIREVADFVRLKAEMPIAGLSDTPTAPAYG